MSYAEVPAQTDAERILAALDDLRMRQDEMMARLDNHAQAINATGENVQWMVANLQGIFAAFSNPGFMSQMMGQMTSMIGANGNAGQPAAGTAAPGQ